MLRLIRALALDRRAATAIEYGLILALIVLAMLVGMKQLGSASSNLWNNVATKMVNAGQ